MSPTLIDDTVKNVLIARVYDVAIESPLQNAPKLSLQSGCQVYLKREDLQPVHSFKLRGAYNKIVNLSDDEKIKGVIAASAGNHAQGVALAAKKLAINALIVMPRTTPSIKIEAVKAYGAEVELAGDSYSDAADYCKQRVQETGRTYIHPFDDPLVIAGQGTIGREIIEQLPTVTHIFVCVGGGGLIAGIAEYVKAIRPEVKIISVEPEDSNAMQRSMEAGERVVLPHVGIFADGVAVKQIGENTFRTVRSKVDDFITVTTDQICSAIKTVFEETRSIVEPAGALAVAGIQQYDLPANAQAVAICSGANMTFERLQQVAERTLLGSGREAMFAVTLQERPGALATFCHEIINGFNISEFNYRHQHAVKAHVLVGINIAGEADKAVIINTMKEKGYEYVDLTNDDLSKEHVRHMVGGSSSGPEQFYEVIFPERPGALDQFLVGTGNDFNISLFHYRSAASDSARIFIGFQTDKRKELESRLDKIGYDYQRLDDAPAVKTFLKHVY